MLRASVEVSRRRQIKSYVLSDGSTNYRLSGRKPPGDQLVTRSYRFCATAANRTGTLSKSVFALVSTRVGLASAARQ
jgi:hypothetical protein